MRKNLKVALGAIIILIIVIVLVWFYKFDKKPVASESYKVSIGYQQIALYCHIFVAKEKGFFKKRGLDVNLIKFSSANLQLQALLADQIDATGLSNMNVIMIIESKEPRTLKLGPFLVWDENSYPDYILTRKGAGISRLQDLENRTIGLHPGSAVRAFSRTVLSPIIDISKCTFIEIKPPTMYDALASKRIDALYCMDPVPTVAIDKGIAEVLLPNPMSRIVPPPTPISAVTFTTKKVKDNSSLVYKIVFAIEDAIDYMRKSEASHEIAEIIAKYTPISADISLKMNPSEFWKLSEVDHDRVKFLANKFAEVGAAPAITNVKNLILNHKELAN